MKRSKIIAITLLSIATIGLTILGIKTGTKPKIQNVNAGLTGTVYNGIDEYNNKNCTTFYNYEHDELNFKGGFTGYCNFNYGEKVNSQYGLECETNIELTINGVFSTENATYVDIEGMGYDPVTITWYDILQDNIDIYEISLYQVISYSSQLNYIFEINYHTTEDNFTYYTKQITIPFGFILGQDQTPRTNILRISCHNLLTEQENFYNNQTYNSYWEGYNTASETVAPVDIAGIMFKILSMPFTFISQAFNLTLWPNTQYEINFANLFKGLIAIATVLFIIKIFTSGFSIVGNYTGKIQDARVKGSQVKLNKAKTDLANRTNPNKKVIVRKKE